jgi:hypothetical protein
MRQDTKEAAPMNLFNLTRSLPHPAVEKPRDADREERDAYLLWLAERAGLDTSLDRYFSDQGATFGRCLKAGLWHVIESQRTPPEYETGAFCVVMPGYGRQPHVTCDILNDDGTTARTITLPADAKGKLPFSKDQAREWSGIAKPARRTAARKAVERVSAVPAPVEPAAAPVTSVAAPVPPVAASRDSDDLVARVEALEATLRRMGLAIASSTPSAANDDARPARRSAGERAAIMRAWRIRCDARARRDLDTRALEAANGAYRGALDVIEAKNAAAVDLERIASLASARADAAEDAVAEMERRADDEAARAVAAEMRADDLARRLWSAEQRAAGADNRVARMVRAAADYRRSARRAGEDVRASRAEARALAGRLATAQRAVAAASARPADPAPTDSVMARAFAAARA